MTILKMILAAVSTLSVGLASIHIAERIRWHEPRRGLLTVAVGAAAAFFAACAFLHHNIYGFFTVSGYIHTVLQMAFAAYFLVSLAYLFHCVEWVLTRLGRHVHFDELLSRILTLAVFAGTDLALFFILLYGYGGM